MEVLIEKIISTHQWVRSFQSIGNKHVMERK